MRFFKKALLFCAGGASYMTLELVWRGWSHSSMFLAGGTCFLLLGRLGRLPMPLWCKALLGAVGVTAVELIAGLLFNREYTVWDYRNQPFSFRGQICLPFSLLWVPVSLIAMGIYRLVDKRI